MRIGFHAPLKGPDHPVPSGDRQMARALMAALRLAGHEVALYSDFRSFASNPEEAPLAALTATAQAEVARLSQAWSAPRERPELLFSYHLYSKAPDLLGPALATRFGLPYVVAEASVTRRHAQGPWAERQALVEAAVRHAALVCCFTERDREGLAGLADPARLLVLPPFIDAARFVPLASPPLASPPRSGPVRLLALAMMRPGDKLASYRFLAEALMHLPALDWHLTLVGDGAARSDVVAAFAGVAPERWQVRGAIDVTDVPAALRDADILAWPGLNEAFGVCYLEAQACGLPVVAVRNAGTPSVIQDGVTGLLTEASPALYAAALAGLITDGGRRARLGAAGTAFIHGERSLTAASRRLDAALEPLKHRGAR